MTGTETETTTPSAPGGKRDLAALAAGAGGPARATNGPVAPPMTDDELVALVVRIAELADDKRAADVVAVDLRGASAYADAFVVCTGQTERQTKAIHDGIVEGLKHGEPRIVPRRVEGLPEARWILIDLADVVVHVFVPESRDFYRLESLWGDRPTIDLPDFSAPPA